MLLRGGDTEARRSGGGFYTPAALGDEFIQRLTKQRELKIEVTVDTL